MSDRTAPSPLRVEIERWSRPLLVRLTRLPRPLVPILTLAVLVVAVLAPVPVALVALAVVAVWMAWLAYLSWPVVGTGSKLLRVAVLVMLVVIAAVRLGVIG